MAIVKHRQQLAHASHERPRPSWALGDKRLVFAEWAAQNPRRRVIEAVATPKGRAALNFSDNTDLALEQAEETLIERLGLDRSGARELELSDTMIARGLDATECAVLATRVQTVRFAAGQVMFRKGDPGDALYISLKGEIGLRLSVEAFDQLKAEHPALAAKLLGNLALHLADRVRILTGDLGHWVSRAAAGRALDQGVPPPLSDSGDGEVVA